MAKQAKQRIKALEKSNEMLKMNLSAFQSTPLKEAEQQLVVYKKEDTKVKHDNAGEAFGGRNSMKEKEDK
jgi:hypothetical protein